MELKAEATEVEVNNGDYTATFFMNEDGDWCMRTDAMWVGDIEKCVTAWKNFKGIKEY